MQIFTRQFRSTRPRTLATRGDVGMFGYPQRFESEILGSAGELRHRDAVVGDEHRDAEFHDGGYSSTRMWSFSPPCWMRSSRIATVASAGQRSEARPMRWPSLREITTV